MLCALHLPRTHFEKEEGNPVSRIFWGRTRLEAATSGYFFKKGNLIQKLVHGLKYKGEQQSGVFLGKMLGGILEGQPGFINTRLIIPVPLHPRKLRKRGYNQSECIAEGLSARLGIPFDAKSLIRSKYSDTQTRKSRYSRWENVEGKFQIKAPSRVAGQHVLLVDDVLTTGATLEACCVALHEANVASISIATVACAMR